MKDSTEANHTKRDFVNEGSEQVDEAQKQANVATCVRQARADRPGPKRLLIFYDRA